MGEHFVVKCSCGVVVSQCRCPSKNKQVRISEEPCSHKTDEASAEYKRLGPECFIDGDVISYQGENFFRACGAFVRDRPDGGQTFCVKRTGHPGVEHEDFDGFRKVGGNDPLAAVIREEIKRKTISTEVPGFPDRFFGATEYDLAIAVRQYLAGGH